MFIDQKFTIKMQIISYTLLCMLQNFIIIVIIQEIAINL